MGLRAYRAVLLLFLAGLVAKYVAIRALDNPQDGFGPLISGDTVVLAQGAHLLVECAGTGTFFACPGSNQFGLIQNLLAIPLAAFGITPDNIVLALSIVNIVSFLSLIALVLVHFNDRPHAAQLMTLVVLAGPLIVYAVFTFAESLQTLVFVGLVLAVIKRRPTIAFALAALAASTRESAIVSLVPLVIAAILASRSSFKKIAFATAGGLLLGIALLLAFNVWKFGTWRNVIHSDPSTMTPGVGLKLEMFLAVWIAPGGGVIPYWFIAAIVCLGLSIAIAFDRTRSSYTRLSAAATLGSLVMTSALLAAWYSPFGWMSWGPRLMIPTVAAACLLTIEMGADTAARALRVMKAKALSMTVLGAVGLLTYLSALPSLGVVVDPAVVDHFFSSAEFWNYVLTRTTETSKYFVGLHNDTWMLWPSQFTLGLVPFRSFYAFGMAALLLFLVLFTFANATSRDSQGRNRMPSSR